MHLFWSHLPTLDVTREASIKFFGLYLQYKKKKSHLHNLDLLESAIACFNSSWEEDSEAGLDRCVLASWCYFSM
jgi:hypothetical protein